jgi:hypothetical protein
LIEDAASIQTTLAINTTGRGLVEITRPVADWTAGTSIETDC